MIPEEEPVGRRLAGKLNRPTAYGESYIKRSSDTGSIPVGSTRKRLKIGNNLESFSTKSTLSGGINRMHDEIPPAWDEIRLDGGWVDLISPEAKG